MSRRRGRAAAATAPATAAALRSKLVGLVVDHVPAEQRGGTAAADRLRLPARRPVRSIRAASAVFVVFRVGGHRAATAGHPLHYDRRTAVRSDRDRRRRKLRLRTATATAAAFRNQTAQQRASAILRIGKRRVYVCNFRRSQSIF